ncbi:MAG TPA: ASKHA domain-containing protein [Nitrospirota bacterium]
MNNAQDGPTVTKHLLRLDPPSGPDTTADLERLLAALGVEGIREILVPLPVAASLPGLLRGSGFVVTATVSHAKRPTLVTVEPGDTTGVNLGLAIDLGTTNVAGMLLDLTARRAIGEVSSVNPQIAHGDDILTRIHYCLEAGHLEELRAEAVSCINGIASKLAADAGADTASISCVSVSGNTTMAHLFLGLDPYGICRSPYTPVANRFDVYRAAELGLAVNPEAPVHVLPNVGSYVGGDVIAGILVSGMHGREELSILVDVGTNAETVIGNRDWLLVCAGAAGPALEGGVVRSGMRAMPGAIERVSIRPDTLEPEYSVIGGASELPRGMCGSALIDMLAELFTSGVIDGRGKFVMPPGTDRVVEVGGRPAYLVVPGPSSATGEDIVFTETDIDNLIRTKAAMYTVLYVVTRELGIEFEGIRDFFIAGTFGAYIDAGKAVTIGMVPDISLDKYRLLGNSSLKGACEALLSRKAMAELGEIAGMITYKEMNVSTEFMTEFRASMFLPHTDSSLFPSVWVRA